MVKPRRDHTLVTLPDGKVIALNGWRNNSINDPIMEAEWYDPQPIPPDTAHTWQLLAPMNGIDNPNTDLFRRDEHSTAALLPDARLIVAGGNWTPLVGPPQQQRTAQIFRPPYLFDANGQYIGDSPVRPVIDDLNTPTEIDNGISFNLKLVTDDAANIKRVAFLRLAAVTHSFDQNARYVPATFSVLDSNTLRVVPPPSRHKLPPGYYMLFVNKLVPGETRPSMLLPSRALMVRVTPPAPMPPP